MFKKIKDYKNTIEELKRENKTLLTSSKSTSYLFEKYDFFCNSDDGKNIINNHLITHEKNGEFQLVDLLVITGIIRTNMNFSTVSEGVLYRSLSVNIMLFIHSMIKQRFQTQVLKTYGVGDLHNKSFWLEDIVCIDPNRGIGTIALSELKRLCRMYGLEKIAGRMFYENDFEKQHLVYFYEKNGFDVTEDNEYISCDLKKS